MKAKVCPGCDAVCSMVQCLTSVNRLLDELATIVLVPHDVAVQFRAAAEQGNPARGLALLDKLDAHFGT